ncbi:hypothetical protein [Nocardia macrotermitis]|uniref:Uncharacterized protein n=1 Tax=Nocardia macrotermitis TaxID=2585198 RepID=A0A7K0D1L5_9NOCA|nr:hypothetical protein [Nocardia macrotermitis]MQY19603.1 hypothetical protein [Nocardia macrotermitis]
MYSQASEYGGRWVQYADGSWAALGDDGVPVPLDELPAAEAEPAALPLKAVQVIDVEPISVHDREIR